MTWIRENLHALTVTGVQDWVSASGNSFHLEVHDPDSGINSILTLLNPSNSAPYDSVLITGFTEDNASITQFSANLKQTSPNLLVVTSHMTMGLQRKHPWLRSFILLTYGVGSFGGH